MLRFENYINMHLSEQHIQLQQLLRCYGQINQGVMNPQSQRLVLKYTIVLIHLPKKMDDSEYHDDVPINPNHFNPRRYPFFNN